MQLLVKVVDFLVRWISGLSSMSRGWFWQAPRIIISGSHLYTL